MLVRRIARPLLASVFLYGGVDGLRNPESKAASAEKFDIPSKPGMDKLNIVSTEQAVKVNAAVQVAGATLLTLNKFPRLASLALAGSLVPTTLAGHAFWEKDDPGARAADQINFLKNLSLFGGLLIASVDTEGRESLARRTKRASRRSTRKAAAKAAKSAAKAQKTATKSSKSAGKKAGKASKAPAHAIDKVRDALPV